MALYGLGDANSSRGHLEALGRYVENGCGVQLSK